MKRRTLLSLAGAGALAAAALLCAPLASAQQTSPGLVPSPTGIVVVELINLHCTRCRAVNEHVPELEQAARAAGMDYRVAPIAYTDQSAWPDRVYYAARDTFPGSEAIIRKALFDGIQQDGLPFEDLPQVLTYLDSEGVAKKVVEKFPAFKLSDVADFAASNAPLYSEVKAANLAQKSLAQEVPVFLWIKDGKIIDSVTPAAAPEPLDLVRLVLSKLQGKPQNVPAAASQAAPSTTQ